MKHGVQHRSSTIVLTTIVDLTIKFPKSLDN
nr:MAG TPA: hypothetical protein [Caudoviricetes sp.]DAP55654.1 MAG TPA: hypothetical protein [Caudoviricetes sp.]DAU55389.1 MAG TPA: hypothetical protein [Caudoviricetes sp.]